MKILLVGKTALSLIFGWALERASHRVEYHSGQEPQDFFPKSISFNLLDARKEGPGQPVISDREVVNLPILSAAHDFDLIVVTVPHSQCLKTAEFLQSRIANANVLFFSNCWAEPGDVARLFPSDRFVWGSPVAGGGLQDEKLEAVIMKKIHFGTFGEPLSESGRNVRKLFVDAGFEVQEHSNFRDWLWLQFALNAGMTAQALEVDDFDSFLGSATQLKRAILAVREAFAVVKARGARMKSLSQETGAFYLPAWLGGLMLQGALRKNSAVKKMMGMHESEEELKQICSDVLFSARELKVSCPRFEALSVHFLQN